MAANTVSVPPSFSRNFTGTFLESLIERVDIAEQQNPSPERDKAFTREWYEGMAQEAQAAHQAS
jgi:hypothetical protein